MNTSELEAAVWNAIEPLLPRDMNIRSDYAGPHAVAKVAIDIVLAALPSPHRRVEALGTVVENAGADHGPGIRWSGRPPTIGTVLYASPPVPANGEAEPQIGVDELAQHIRLVDGENKLGAGELAEKILPFILRHARVTGAAP